MCIERHILNTNFFITSFPIPRPYELHQLILNSGTVREKERAAWTKIYTSNKHIRNFDQQPTRKSKFNSDSTSAGEKGKVLAVYLFLCDHISFLLLVEN